VLRREAAAVLRREAVGFAAEWRAAEWRVVAFALRR
jgi:hypothetical protein